MPLSCPRDRLHLRLSSSYQFAFQYDQAIDVLDEAIEKYPGNKELYIQRIAAYFELGRYDEAIRDFVLQELDKEIQPETDLSKAVCAKAFLCGASKGTLQGAYDVPYTILYSLRGAGQLVWATAHNPIEVPSLLIAEIDHTITLIRNGQYGEIVQAAAPELYDLCVQWNSLNDDVRWEKAGFVFGK
jgi:tetratricopeptide (TPR) repeat protein